jgi:hypothetical protein
MPSSRNVPFPRRNATFRMDQGSDFECEFRARRIRVRGNYETHA